MSLQTLPFLTAWREADDATRLDFLRELVPAQRPVECAQQALLNLTDLEWVEVCDWLTENHWLPLA